MSDKLKRTVCIKPAKRGVSIKPGVERSGTPGSLIYDSRAREGVCREKRFLVLLCAFLVTRLVTRRKSPYFSHLTSYILLSARRRRAGYSVVSGFPRQIRQRDTESTARPGLNQVVLWLQRSRMSIETGCKHDPRSSGAQCFRHGAQVGLPFRSAGARRNL